MLWSSCLLLWKRLRRLFEVGIILSRVFCAEIYKHTQEVHTCQMWLSVNAVSLCTVLMWLVQRPQEMLDSLTIYHGIHLCMNKSCFFQMPAVRLVLSNITSLTESAISPLKHWVKDLFYVTKINIWKYIQYDWKLVSMWLLELML